MMQFSLLFLLISLMSVSVTLQGVIRNDENNGNVKTLNYQSSVKEIVKDLIAAWSSPLVYLKNRGYLSAPEIGFDMLLKDDKLGERKARSNEEETPNDLSHLFRTLFSSSDSNVSDKIKSKLGVPWDMTALKNSVRNEAFKYYEKFYDKRNQQASKNQGDGETDIDRQVAQLYPTVVFTPNKEHADEEQKKVIEEVASHKEPKLINGIAKLLSSRAKPMPLQQLKEQKEQKQALDAN
ncbi:uncharacterized protein [Drosophila virilis]|uniref:Uncharacterized protein n=1 Tax=Drosophila virilis TaxID=7244 RepID=B4LML8_DROVI|nr:uncharacterized protein LOC6625041 [Drosophila virilis]EDW60005.1 uncharacterized protein Dvir_GJ21112 [Drosophila virilis]